MNPSDWSEIPAKLKAKGFSVFYDRVSYEPERPLWRAKANRDGRQWSTLGENLGTALVKLERETENASADLPEMAPDDKPETNLPFRQVPLPPTPKA
jgi:hypothetical protein